MTDRIRMTGFGRHCAMVATAVMSVGMWNTVATAQGTGAKAGAGANVNQEAAEPGDVETRMLQWFRPDQLDRQFQWESMLNQIPLTESLRVNHLRFTSEPHPAGTEADQRMIEELAKVFTEYGVEVERHDIWPLLAFPEEASVTVHHDGASIELGLVEDPVPGDAFSQHPDRPIGWNAYSGSGTVTGEVVYVNYGRKADFEALLAHGVDFTDRIVIARYGGNYRGYKAKFAEEVGAAGLIIFTDPKDSGFARGAEYPDGGFCNGTSIQRGSIKTLPYVGDPLTPDTEATEDAARVDADSVALPRIPVQPIGWDAASEILSRMAGEPLPEELKEQWQGALPFEYALTGGSDLTVELHVKQRREITKTTNVLGVIRGSKLPREMVIVGCHFDAWTFGAGDPHAGTIILYEMARAFSHAVTKGFEPDRTIVFANWAAEEFGIIGSTEWVEANRIDLGSRAVAYINLDMAAMGDRFRASSSPELSGAIIDATLEVPQANGGPGETVFDSWSARTEGTPRLGTLGGGSDHVGFLCHVGVPSCSLGAGGSSGVSYHSNYDNVAWYNKVVGDDYEGALMVTRVANTLVARLSNAAILPMDHAAYADRAATELSALTTLAEERGLTSELPILVNDLRWLANRHRDVMADLRAIDSWTPLNAQKLGMLNSRQRMWSRLWLHGNGLPERPWYRNTFAATDPDSGYASWTMPGLRLAIQRGDQLMFQSAFAQLRENITRMHAQMNKLEHVVQNVWRGDLR